MNTNIHEWRILKIKIEIRVHSCSFVAKMERLNTHTEIAIVFEIGNGPFILEWVDSSALASRRENHGPMRKKTPVTIIIFAFAFTRFSQTVPANAQHSVSGRIGESAAPLSVSANRQQKDDFIVPSRPTVSEPADIQRVGVLQLEFGLDAEFDAKEFRNQQSTPLDLRFAALSRLLLDFQLKVVKSQVDRTGGRMTGVGDAIIGLQVVAFKRAGYPTFAFVYHSKLPTASKEKNLGSGRVDHRAVLLISDQIGYFDLNINAAYMKVCTRNLLATWASGASLSRTGAKRPRFENVDTLNC